MCGIAGAASLDGIDPRLLPRMAEAIRHRGPDGEGYLLYRPDSGVETGSSEITEAASREPAQVGFAHLRLSIIDLTAASDQPMVDRHRGLSLIYNGELYNYVELRRELEGLGHAFGTSGDTEVVLAAYAEWGADCLQRLVGMWAFAILDLRRRALFLAVDRFGIKPLFYAISGGSLHFASEIKALLKVPSLRPEPNEAVVRPFLLTGRVDDTAQSFFTGINRMLPGHCATVPLEGEPLRVQPESYWSIPDNGYRGSRSEAAEEFRERFSESVRLHLRSDVPVGTCLSGGLDSSAIVCVAEDLRGEGRVPRYAHHGFGYVPEDPSVSERPHMEEVVRKTSIDMTYVRVGHDRFRQALVEIARLQDEPFGSTSIAAQWFVFEAAKKAGLKVMLDGQGADEVLGGYHHYFAQIAVGLARNRSPLRYLRFNRQHRAVFGRSVLPLRSAFGLMLAGRLTTEPQISSSSMAPLLSDRLRSRVETADLVYPKPDSINEMLAAHTSRIGMPSLLRFEDRNSMAHSIEARVPFLDHRLVEFAFSLPGAYKIDGVETKAVLREAMRGTLPEPIRQRRDKIGFRAQPSATWELAQRHRQSLLQNRTPYEENWFDPVAIGSFLDGSSQSAVSEFLLWRLLNTKLWLRSFWGGDADPLAS